MSTCSKPADADARLEQRIRRKRSIQLRRAKATIELMIDEIGAHACGALFNDELREALDRLDGEA